MEQRDGGWEQVWVPFTTIAQEDDEGPKGRARGTTMEIRTVRASDSIMTRVRTGQGSSAGLSSVSEE